MTFSLMVLILLMVIVSLSGLAVYPSIKDDVKRARVFSLSCALALATFWTAVATIFWEGLKS